MLDIDTFSALKNDDNKTYMMNFAFRGGSHSYIFWQQFSKIFFIYFGWLVG